MNRIFRSIKKKQQNLHKEEKPVEEEKAEDIVAPIIEEKEAEIPVKNSGCSRSKETKKAKKNLMNSGLNLQPNR